MQVVSSPGTQDDSLWIKKAVVGMKYHGYRHLRLLEAALKFYNAKITRDDSSK